MQEWTVNDKVFNSKKNGNADIPLVSMIIISYNQENYICQTIESVLCQTHSPLEVIISDDHSTDRTWEKIISAVNSYSGPHRVVLNRNSTNLGVNRNINEAHRLVSGEFVVIAAGDDISYPNRVSQLVKNWGAGASGVFSNAIVFNPDAPTVNRLFGSENFKALSHWKEMIEVGHHGSWGCGLGWDRKLYDIFGEIPESPLGEDAFIPFRCALADGFSYIPDPLVRYRDHGGNISFWARKKHAAGGQLTKLGIEIMQFDISMYKCWQSDLRVAAEKGLISASEAQWADSALCRHIKLAEKIIVLLKANILLLPALSAWYSFHIFSRNRKYAFKKMLHLLLLYRFSFTYNTIQKIRGKANLL